MPEQRGGFGCLAVLAMAFAAIIVAMLVLRRPTASVPGADGPKPNTAKASGKQAEPSKPIDPVVPTPGHHPVRVAEDSAFAGVALDALLNRPIYGKGARPLVFAKLDATEGEPKAEAAHTAREYLDLQARGYGLPLSDAVAALEIPYRRVAEPIRFLRRASASRRSAVATLTLSGLGLGAFPGRMVGGEEKPWIEIEPQLRVVEATPTRLVAESPMARTEVRLIAHGDFNADEIEDLLVTVHRQPRPAGPPQLQAVLLGRDRPDAPLKWIEPPPLDDNRNLGPVRIAKTDEGQWGLYLRGDHGRKLVAPLVPSVQVLQMSVSRSGRYAMVWSLLRRDPLLKIVEVFDLKTAEPVEQFELKPPSTSESLRWVHGDRLLRSAEQGGVRLYTLYDHAGRRLYEEEIQNRSAVSPGGRYLVIHNRLRPPLASKVSVLDLKAQEPAFVSDTSWQVKDLAWSSKRLEIEYTSLDGQPRRHVLILEEEF